MNTDSQQSNEPVIYQLDGEDHIVHVNAAWDRYARDNMAPHLTSDTVVGHSLWEYVTGNEVRHLTDILLSRARAGHPVERLPFRCDSPSLRRYWQMTMRPLADGGISIETFERRVEPRPPNPLLQVDPVTVGEPIRMCAWCRRVDMGGDFWVEAEEAVLILKLFELDHPPPISHTICPDDMHRFGDEID